MELADIVRDAWGFAGLVPRTVHHVNPFGNLIVEDATGRYWRICPEELECELVASSRAQFESLWTSEDFQLDWRMDRLADVASVALGQPPAGRCFCLKVPAVLGGKYDVENFGVIDLTELISVSGDIALQIDGLPDGARVVLKVTE